MPEILIPIFLCQACRREIGILVRIEDLTLLQINGMLLRGLHGTCSCGAPIHFATNDILLSDLIKKVMNHDKIKLTVK
jgi:hypothetical protein